MINITLWNKLGLKGKTIISLGALMLLALLVMGGTIYYQAMTLTVNELLESTGKNIEKDVIGIENFIKNSKDDLMVMTDTPPIQGLIRSRANNGIDPLTGDKTEYWYARMTQIFSAFLRYHPEYYHLRYIDQQGNEIVRAELRGKNIRVTPKNELQNKAQYAYFTETMKLKEDEIYYSEVNLDRENGVIQIPHTSAFRISTPVYDAQKKVRGIVIINIVTDAMFSNIRTAIGESKKYIVNQDGYFLVHPDKSKEFGFDLGFDYRITNELPEFAEEMKLSNFNVKNHEEEHHIDSFKKIFFDPMNKNRYWAVVHQIPAAQAFKNVYLARNMMFAIGFFVIGFSLAIITWISTRKIVTPILKLSEAVNKMGHGDLTARAPEDGRSDEIGELASSINRMADIIQKNVNELTVLNRVTVAASSSLSAQVMANNALDAILELQLLKFQNKGGIFITDEKTLTLRLAASRGFSKEQETLDAVVPFGDCLCGIVAATGEQILTERCCDDPRHTRKYAGITPHGHLVLPLKSGEKVLGVLVLYLEADTKMATDETRLYRSLADVIAVALQNVQHFEQIEKMATAVKESNERYLALYDGIDDALLVHGIAADGSPGKFLEVNAIACRRLGYSREELFAMTPLGIDAPEFAADMRPVFEQIMAGNSVTFNQIHVTKDGRRIPVEIRSRRFVLQGKSAIMSLARDITERKRAEEGIRGYAEQYQAMLSAALFGFWLTDDKGKLLDVNDAYCAMSGYTREELLKLSIPDLEIIEKPEETARHIQKIIETGKDRFESRHKAKDGRVFDVEISTSFWHSQRKFVVFVSDITERKLAVRRIHENYEIQQTMNRLLAIALEDVPLKEQMGHALEAVLSAPFLSIMPKGGIFLVEQEPEMLLLTAHRGLASAIQGACARLPFGTCLCGRAAADREIQFADCLDHRHEITYEGISPHGHYNVPILIRGRVLGVLVLYLNEGHTRKQSEIDFLKAVANALAGVIQRKRAEEDLYTLNAELELRITDRTRELEGMKDLAESANRAKSDFLANMSHELRTPLNAVIGFSEIMRDGLSGPVNDEQKDYLGNILTSGKHLLQLINEILDLSKVEAGKMELELAEMSVREVLVGSLIMLKEKAMKHRIVLKTALAPDMGTIIADERKLRQVVYNLLSNAVKFTLDGGEVGLTAERMPGKVRVTVWDTGIGIKAGDIGTLFAPFKQIDSKLSRIHQGTGLGLNLSKKLVELHGGRIWAESEYEKGSRFIFEVPAEPYPPVPADPLAYESVPDPEAPHAPSPRLLRRQFFLEYLEQITAYHKRNSLGFGVMRFSFIGRNAQETFAPAAVLRELVRSEEKVGRGDDPCAFEVILVNVNQEQAETASRRLQDGLRNAGLTVEARLAVYPDDGQDVAALLRRLGGG